MHTLAWPLALALVVGSASSRDASEPRYAPALGTILERRIEIGTEVEFLRHDTLQDGKADGVPPAIKLMGLNRAFPDMHQVWVVEDEILSVDAGQPTKLVRTFRDMSGVYFATPMAKLAWKGEEDGLVLELVPDFDPQSLKDPGARKVVMAVPFDLECARVLPPRAVRVGDAWTITPEDLPLAGQVADLELLRGIEVRCRLVEVRGAAEDRLAVIAFDLEHAGETALKPGDSDWIEGDEVEVESGKESFTLEGRGELVWSLSRNRGHACSLSIERVDERHVVGRALEEPKAMLDHHSSMKYVTTLALTISEIRR